MINETDSRNYGPRSVAKYKKDKIKTVKSIYDFTRGKGYPIAPIDFQLDMSTACNIQCLMCSCGHSYLNPLRRVENEIRKKGFMLNMNEIKKNIHEMAKHALACDCFGAGEPTIHPEYPKFLQMLSQYEVFTTFSTNGMNMNNDLIKIIVDCGVGLVKFSFSCVIKEDYEAIYKGACYETVLSNIKKLAEEKIKKNSRYPIIQIWSLGFTKHLENLVDFVKVMGEAGVNNIFLDHLYVHGGFMNFPEFAPHAAIYRPWVEGKIIKKARMEAEKRNLNLDTSGFEFHGVKNQEEYEERINKLYSFCGTSINNVPNITLNEIGKRSVKQIMASEQITPREQFSKEFISKKSKFDSARNIYCLSPFIRALISLQGNIKPCCIADETKPLLGNIKEKDALKTWKAKFLKKQMIRDKYPEFCSKCIKGSYYYSQANVAHYLNIVKAYTDWFRNRFNDDINLEFSSMKKYGVNKYIVERQTERLLKKRLKDLKRGIRNSLIPYLLLFDKIPVNEKISPMNIDLVNNIAQTEVNDLYVNDKTETVELAGWAIDINAGKSLKALYVKIDNTLIRCSYELERPDVAGAFGSEDFCQTGFIVSIKKKIWKKTKAISFIQIAHDGSYQYEPKTYNIHYK
jgi:MoaA/NifB/PqqE/SkfB family radical SAM enzyme